MRERAKSSVPVSEAAVQDSCVLESDAGRFQQASPLKPEPVRSKHSLVQRAQRGQLNALGMLGMTILCTQRAHPRYQFSIHCTPAIQRSHVRPLLGTLSDLFRMLSPSSVKQIPVRSSLQLQLLSRISQIWLPVDSKSRERETSCW